jgi:NADPH-dependent glutamate synthase beta subunit-like oxidoreductase
MDRPANDSQPKFAVVGAGPAGFYAAEALVAAHPTSAVDLIERLPTPFGLIRSGVAPDHQTTKTIQDTFEAIARLPNLRLVGNVAVDTDISIDALTELYDAVVLACGAPHDAPLDMPGGNLPGVYGASEFVGWYNAHPDHAALDPRLDGEAAVIIGNGNVAIDVARILSKAPSELASSDIADHALDRLRGSRISDVTIAGRRGPLDAKFTTIELGELGELRDVVALAEPQQIPQSLGDGLPPRERRVKAKNLECFQAFARADASSAARRIRFRFYARPIQVLGRDRAEAVRFERSEVRDGRVVGSGETFDVPCGLVVSAIGYRARMIGGLALAESGDRLQNVDGRIGPGLYVVGWLKRGPSGKIGTNRADGDEIAERIRSEVVAGGKPGFVGLEKILRERGLRWTDFADWKRIEGAEIAAARAGSPRRKFASVREMLAHCAKVPEAVG